MTIRVFVAAMLLTVVLISCSRKMPENMVLVGGGTFVNTKSNLYGKKAHMSDFYMGKFEVTQKEWTDVMGGNPSKFKGDNLPVESVSWYDCVEYCNKRSVKEGLRPYYTIDTRRKDPVNRNELDSIKWTVTTNPGADGYRLPTEAEWEYAAGGGRSSRSYAYSGSNNPDSVAWYWRNSGDSLLTGFWHWATIEKNHCATKPVGGKKPNELGLYDMSGNVREWCEDWYEDNQTAIGLVRVQRGGGWLGADFCCESYSRGSFEASGKGPDQGFRLCRNN